MFSCSLLYWKAVFHCIDESPFVYPFRNWQVFFLQILTIMDIVSRNVDMQVSLCILGKQPGVKLLGNTVSIFQKKLSTWFPRLLASCIPNSNAWKFQLLHILVNTWNSQIFFMLVISVNVFWYHIMGLICISLVISVFICQIYALFKYFTQLLLSCLPIFELKMFFIYAGCRHCKYFHSVYGSTFHFLSAFEGKKFQFL